MIWLRRIGVITSLTFSSCVGANSLPDISAFAAEICDSIRLEGSISRQEIETKLEGSLAGVWRLVGASGAADGAAELESFDYQGLPYDSLPSQLIDARECRKELAVLLIRAREENEPEPYVAPPVEPIEPSLPTTSSLIGEWEGHVATGRKRYFVEVKIERLEVGKYSGRVEYSRGGFSCAGYRSFVRQDAGAYIFDEIITEGDPCASSKVKILSIDANRLQSSWHRNSVSNMAHSNAILIRKQGKNGAKGAKLKK
jgi:hypothetical protein